jgi:hypothetical protein
MEKRMAEVKTKPNDRKVESYLSELNAAEKQRDSLVLLAMYERLTGEKARMWGDSIIGFGEYVYQYIGGRSGVWPRMAFSPRKQTLTLYNMERLSEYPDLASRLGKYTVGKSCLYVKRLADINLDVLEELIRRLWAD